MKKRMTLLALLALSAVKANTVPENTRPQDSPVSLVQMVKSIEQPLEVFFEDGSYVAGTINELAQGHYVYQAELIVDGSVLGIYNLYFQTSVDSNGDEVVLLSTAWYNCSNPETEQAMAESAKGGGLKSRHDTVKNSVGNLR